MYISYIKPMFFSISVRKITYQSTYHTYLTSLKSTIPGVMLTAQSHLEVDTATIQATLQVSIQTNRQ